MNGICSTAERTNEPPAPAPFPLFYDILPLALARLGTGSNGLEWMSDVRPPARPSVRPSDITTSDYPTLLSSSSPMQTHARDPSAPRCAAAFARSPPFAKWSAGLCPPLFIVIFIASRSPPSATLVAKKPTASSGGDSSLENRQCDMQCIIGRATRGS